MTKSASKKKAGKTHMDSRLSEPEVDAALQLIQLSGESSSTDVNHNHNNNNRCGRAGNGGLEEEESVGNSAADHEITSAMKDTMIDGDNLDDEACPPRNRKFRSVLDIYLNTKPLIRKQGKKK